MFVEKIWSSKLKKYIFRKITKSNSSFSSNNFKILSINAKLYEKETGKKLNKDKVISKNKIFFTRNQYFKFCKILNDDRIIVSSNTSLYKNMISQELDSEINIKSKNCIPSKYELIVNLNVLKLSKNHLFTVEVHFEHPLIHILKSDF